MFRKKILIVGGAGFLGSALTSILDDDFTVYDNLLYHEEYLYPYKFVYGDVRDENKLKRIFPKFDTIIWMAAIVGDGACLLHPSLAKEVNEFSVKFLSQHFQKRIIFLSTCSVYGYNRGVLTEKSPVCPLSLYAETKLNAEKYLKEKNALILRLGTLFGISARPRFDLVVNTLCLHAYLDKKITVFGMDKWRPLLHVMDAAKTIKNNLWNNKTGIYNLVAENLRIINIAKKVQKVLPRTKLAITESHFEDKRSYKVCSEKAKKELNFKPERDVLFGIRETLGLLKSQRIKNPSESKYSNMRSLV